jgi:hypothetical protein
MTSFKQFYKRPVLGVGEVINIAGIGPVKAKVDSGNEAFNVLHGTNIKDENNEISFTTIDNKKIKKPKHDTITIHIGSGVKEDRPVVLFDIKIDGREYRDIPFSIADRTENDEPVLVGEPFVNQLNALIDVKKDSTEA